jgi:5'-methylthioadenosine phosphorylase
MTSIGIIGGTNLFKSTIFSQLSRDTVTTTHGVVTLFSHPSGLIHIIPRHGEDGTVPPHLVNHHANLMALQSRNVDRIIGITSVGSLRITLSPGIFLIPEDFIQLSDVPTFFNDNSRHITPRLSHPLRKRLFDLAIGVGIPTRMEGIYLQTTGPRFETPAEIRLFSTFADIVGMNMASEASLACELDIPYANISIVDNYGNGIAGEITYEEFLVQVSANQEMTDRLLNAIIDSFQKDYK